MKDTPESSGPQFRANRPKEPDTVRTTIVGGRPPGSGKPQGNIPRGVEVLITKASVDQDFRQLLLDKREEAARSIGLPLDPAETLMLKAASRQHLNTIIDRTSLPEEHRRVFLGTAAAAMLAVIGTIVPGCAEPEQKPVTGMVSDRPMTDPAKQGENASESDVQTGQEDPSSEKATPGATESTDSSDQAPETSVFGIRANDAESS